MRYVEMQLLEPYIVQSSFNDTKELNSTFQALVIINQSMLRTFIFGFSKWYNNKIVCMVAYIVSGKTNNGK